MKSICLMYHDLYNSTPLSSIPRSATMYHVSKENFKRHLNIIKTSGRKVLSALDNNNFQVEEYIDEIEENGFEFKSVNMTFDNIGNMKKWAMKDWAESWRG